MIQGRERVEAQVRIFFFVIAVAVVVNIFLKLQFECIVLFVDCCFLLYECE